MSILHLSFSRFWENFIAGAIKLKACSLPQNAYGIKNGNTSRVDLRGK
jgi:hypothetical protein